MFLRILGGLTLLLFASCAEEDINPYEKNMTPPGQVSNVKVENMPGKVKLTYALPSDQDLLYVKAVYFIREGVSREIKASYYTNSMILDGFAEAKDYDVQLYAVNRSDVASEPCTVTVQPLENPIWNIYRSLKILPDFSGVRFTAENPTQADVALEIIKLDSTGRWNPFPPYIYTSRKEISSTTRGLDTIPQSFGVTVRDKFLNYTDTLYATVTPYYEIEIPKSGFQEIRLPGDAQIQTATAGMPLIWDGNSDPGNYQRMLTETWDLEPQTITFYLGQSAKLSRLKIWNFREWVTDSDPQFYYKGQLRFFEVWGSDNPDPDGSWDSWVKLGSFENVKPSGLPYGQCSAEDVELALAGFNYDLDPNAPKVSYLRIKSLENWIGTSWMEILEVSVFGDPR